MNDGQTPSNDRAQLDPERLAELLADEQLGQLSPEDRAELESARAANPGIEQDLAGQDSTLIGSLLVAMDEAAQHEDSTGGMMPVALAEKIEARGHGVIGPAIQFPRRSVWPWLSAACALLAVGIGIFAWSTIERRSEALDASQQQIAMLKTRMAENENVLAAAREVQASLRAQVASAASRELELAEQLAAATSDLEMTKLAIAKYETPLDPAELAQRRQKLLEVPDTIRVAWQPFDLPDAPAEQPGVRGDVVWNDELEQGFLRFVGLDVNDPAIEQYQVWVIDERGLEQKVSGGVFNASAEGEVIVPIDPAIDVGRVALFAITVENPGGTWVPDLSRRVVVAPRDAG